MIEFRKTGCNDLDVRVRMSSESTVEDVLDATKRFMLACGYVLDPMASFDVVPDIDVSLDVHHLLDRIDHLSHELEEAKRGQSDK